MKKNLPSMMTAAVLYGARDVRVERRNTPLPNPGEIVIAVEAALTDGTDLKVFRRGYHARMITPPAIFGHEYAGRIAAIGRGVSGWRIGDRVLGANSAPCGSCFHCVRDQESLCDDILFVNGAYAQYLKIPERIVRRNLLAIPDHLPAEAAALTEPLACVVKGIRELGIQSGETAAILGSGPIGLMAARLAALAGARVIVTGRRAAQLSVARDWGVTEIIGPDIPVDLAGAVRDAVGGRGPDRVFEATGSPEIWEQAISAVRRGGAVNLFGGCPAGARVSLDARRLHYDELTIHGSFHHTPADIREAFELINAGRIDPSRLFDSEESLDRLPVVLQEMDDRRRTLKTVIRPGVDF